MVEMIITGNEKSFLKLNSGEKTVRLKRINAIKAKSVIDQVCTAPRASGRKPSNKMNSPSISRFEIKDANYDFFPFLPSSLA